jgi:hypothetical protein
MKAITAMDIRSGEGVSATVGSLYKTSSESRLARLAATLTDTVDSMFQEKPNTLFVAVLNDNMVYYNPYLLVNRGVGSLAPSLMQEALHNLDKGTDEQPRSKLGAFNGAGSFGITMSLYSCLPF